MKPTFADYLKAAFNARPIGMFVPPNWIALGGFFLLGLLEPAFWLVGAGLELGYLYSLTFNSRFRRLVDGLFLSRQRRQWERRQAEQITLLNEEDQRSYRALEARCATILQQQAHQSADAAVAMQAQGLVKMLWIYLRLLLTRQGIAKILSDPQAEQRILAKRIKDTQDRLQDPALNEQLRKSLTSQLEILQQRLEGQGQAREKLAFLDAELSRIREQVELIREQAALTTDPQTVSDRIDQVTATLGGTTQWIREQQQIYGQVEELMTEPPPPAMPPALPRQGESA